MNEYIERTAVHELVKRLPKYHMFSYDRTESLIGISPDDVDFGVDKIPAAEVVEVRHGRWIFDHMTGDRAYYANCSECGLKKHFKDEEAEQKKKYCSFCGARMDKEDEHEAD